MISSEAEIKAKNYLLNLILKGNSEPCDEYLNDQSFDLPKWYNEKIFKRGQKYCIENRSSILIASFYGGISVICDPKTAKVLIRGKSKDIELAKTRGLSTGLSVFLWFKEDLKPGSRSFESLKRIRKIHLNASRAAERNEIGFITQYDMFLQHFAAMGYALIKPSFFGISNDCDENKEAYVHFYAVIGNLLGIKDEFNLCLQELKVVEIICHSILRYVFYQNLQVHSPEFIQITKGFSYAVNKLIPFSSYEAQIFMIKRLNSIFGYQYNVNVDREKLQKQIFSTYELNMIQNSFKIKNNIESLRSLFFDQNLYKIEILRNESKISENFDVLENYYALKNDETLKILKIKEDFAKIYFNDEKFHELCKSDQIFLFLFTNFLNLLKISMIKSISNKIVDILLCYVEWKLKKI